MMVKKLPKMPNFHDFFGDLVGIYINKSQWEIGWKKPQDVILLNNVFLVFVA
jgi:hypothetical protein